MRQNNEIISGIMFEEPVVEDMLIYYGNGKAIFREVILEYKRARGVREISPWADVLERHGSDKAVWHSYPLFYEKLFSLLPRPPLSIFEVGLGTNNLDVAGNMGANGIPGASHRAWRELFPNAQIYGADIDPRILFDEPGIRTFYLDQNDVQTINTAWGIMPHLRFDVVIDDGAHTFEANSTLADATFARLNEGGLYIIEDIVSTMDNLCKFDKYLTNRGWDACLVRLPHEENEVDNTVAVIRPF